jgi:transcriptional regulator
MYIPRHFARENRAGIISFMKQYSFATLVTATQDYPLANHLPFVIKEEDGRLFITGHFAKGNEQWQQITGRPVLVIFSEPHAYISPKHYEKVMNVPTWNYAAVHAYGIARIVEPEQEKLAVLEQMIDLYEPAYRQQWQHLPDDYKLGMLNGIVAFEITVTDLQAKNKLSQNKTEAERRRIVNALLESDVEHERVTGLLMKQELQRESGGG